MSPSEVVAQRSQSSNTVLMVYPSVHVGYNVETAVDNHFMVKPDDCVHAQILSAFDLMVAKLRSHGVHVIVAPPNDDIIAPDCIFPNNWITVAGGVATMYAMKAATRRVERRQDIIELLREHGFVKKVDDFYSAFESKQRYLEGTGALVLDHTDRVAYVCLSERADGDVAAQWCQKYNYRLVAFRAYDSRQRPVYHTNVMMAVGAHSAVVCLQSIADPAERNAVLQSLHLTGRHVVEISLQQMECFCGNVIELNGEHGEPLLLCSQQAYNAFDPAQLEALRGDGGILDFVVCDVGVIERTCGGGVRCMVAELFPSN